MRQFMVPAASEQATGDQLRQHTRATPIADMDDGSEKVCRKCETPTTSYIKQGKSPNWSYICRPCQRFEVRKARVFKSTGLTPADWSKLSKQERDAFNEQCGQLSQSELCNQMKLKVQMAKDN